MRRSELTDASDVQYNITDENNGEGRMNVDGSSNSEGLGEYGTDRSGDGIRKQSDDTEGIHRGLGRRTREIQLGKKGRKGAGTFEYIRDLQQSFQRYGESISRDLSRINLKDIDVLGRKISTSVKEYFKETVTKNSDGYLLPFFHGTLADFDIFERTPEQREKYVPDYKEHDFAKDGFNYRTAYFMDNDGSYYKLTLSVGKTGEIKTIYNVGKIKEGFQHVGALPPKAAL